MDLSQCLALVQDADPQWDPWGFWAWQRGLDALDWGHAITVPLAPKATLCDSSPPKLLNLTPTFLPSPCPVLHTPSSAL